MAGLDEIDLAKVEKCPTPDCQTMVRRMGSVPIRGTGLDGEASGPWYCDECIQRPLREAVERINAARAAERSR